MKIPTWLFALVSCLLLFPLAGARGDAPQLLSYQGVLMRSDGTVVPDAIYDLTFRVYQHPTSIDPSDLLFEQTLTVQVEAGLYNVILSNNELGSGDVQAVFSGSLRFMEVTIGENPTAGVLSATTLFPRQQIGSVPFALVANQARELIAPVGLPSGAIILWDRSNECPETFEEAPEFRGLTVRGADALGADDGIPDQPGETCPGGVGCAPDPDRYDDTMQEAELVNHDHPSGAAFGPLFDEVPGGAGTFNNDQVAGFDGSNSVAGNPAGGAHGGVRENRGVTPQGGGEASYQPLRTVLFCRKL